MLALIVIAYIAAVMLMAAGLYGMAKEKPRRKRHRLQLFTIEENAPGYWHIRKGA